MFAIVVIPAIFAIVMTARIFAIDMIIQTLSFASIAAISVIVLIATVLGSL